MRQYEYRSGLGWDIHPLVTGRILILGGVQIACELGGAGHSDADVLSHAITDALLGAAGLGDIGQHFPDTDPQWAGADSQVFLRRVRQLVAERGYTLIHLDATVVMERPKLNPYRQAIREKLAETLGLDLQSVSVKFKTAEGFGAVGEGQAVEAFAVATLRRAATADQSG